MYLREYLEFVDNTYIQLPIPKVDSRENFQKIIQTFLEQYRLKLYKKYGKKRSLFSGDSILYYRFNKKLSNFMTILDNLKKNNYQYSAVNWNIKSLLFCSNKEILDDVSQEDMCKIKSIR